MVIRNAPKNYFLKSFAAILFLLSSVFGPSITNASNQNTIFEIDVSEALSVSIVTPATWASGAPTASSAVFLRNTVTLEVASNNSTGFTAMMYAVNTALTNTSKSTATIPTLGTTSTGCSSYTSGVVKSSFPSNCWGYSLDATTQLNNKDYNETDGGNSNSYYHPLVDGSATPISILTGTGASAATRKIYLGAKADNTQASGTYIGTIVISVVTGTVDTGNTGGTNPTNPTEPAKPQDTSGTNPAVSYDPYNNRTIYTSTSTSASTNTTTTEISTGDTTAAYSDPAGVTTINEGTPMATGLAVTSVIAAATGFFFLIAAKRRREEEEDQEY